MTDKKFDKECTYVCGFCSTKEKQFRFKVIRKFEVKLGYAHLIIRPIKCPKCNNYLPHKKYLK